MKSILLKNCTDLGRQRNAGRRDAEPGEDAGQRMSAGRECRALLALALAACTGDAGGSSGRDSSIATSAATSGAPVVAGITLAAPRSGPAGEWQTPAGDYAARASASSRRSRRRTRRTSGLVDVLDRRAARTRGAAARREQHDVPRHAVPERLVRARPHAPGHRSSGSSVPRTRRRRRACVLRRRESRRRIRGRQDLLQPARRTHRRRRRRDRASSSGARAWAT